MLYYYHRYQDKQFHDAMNAIPIMKSVTIETIILPFYAIAICKLKGIHLQPRKARNYR